MKNSVRKKASFSYFSVQYIVGCPGAVAVHLSGRRSRSKSGFRSLFESIQPLFSCFCWGKNLAKRWQLPNHLLLRPPLAKGSSFDPWHPMKSVQLKLITSTLTGQNLSSRALPPWKSRNLVNLPLNNCALS